VKIAILTSPEQWFVPYAESLVAQIPKAKLFFRHEEINKDYAWVFILS